MAPFTPGNSSRSTCPRCNGSLYVQVDQPISVPITPESIKGSARLKLAPPDKSPTETTDYGDKYSEENGMRYKDNNRPGNECNHTSLFPNHGIKRDKYGNILTSDSLPYSSTTAPSTELLRTPLTRTAFARRYLSNWLRRPDMAKKLAHINCSYFTTKTRPPRLRLTQ